MDIFDDGNITVAEVAKIIGKDACWVRAGIITGYFPIGVATRNGKRITSIDEISSKKGRINYYISPKLLYEQTGYLWRKKNGIIQESKRES